MNCPGFAQLLTEAQVRRVHEASLQILQEVGLEVQNTRARARFKQRGCGVADDSRRVTIPPHVVEQHLKSVPAKFTFHARNPELIEPSRTSLRW
jgi:trimethylamine---corrinoid protein Co-methyltransferase